MPLVVETGSGTDSTANTYVSVADAAAFLGDRGISAPTEGQLLQAMDTIEALLFVGSKTVETSPLSFPRTDIADKYGTAFGENVIPPELINAQIWLGHYIATGSNPASVPGQEIRSKRIDTNIEREYFESKGDGGALSIESLPNFYSAIAHLISSGVSTNSSSVSGRIQRA